MSSVDYNFRMRTAAEAEEELQRLLKYTPQEFEINRNGRLSPAQVQRIIQNDVASPLMWSGLTVLGAFLVRYIYYLFGGMLPLEALVATLKLPKMASEEDVDGGLFLASEPLLFIGPVLAILWRLRRFPWKLALDVLTREVIQAEGKLDVEMRGVNDGMSSDDRRTEWRMQGGGKGFEDWDDTQAVYKLRIGHYKLPVPKAIVVNIEEGSRYTAYFTRFGHRLVALVPKR